MAMCARTSTRSGIRWLLLAFVWFAPSPAEAAMGYVRPKQPSDGKKRVETTLSDFEGVWISADMRVLEIYANGTFQISTEDGDEPKGACSFNNRKGEIELKHARRKSERLLPGPDNETLLSPGRNGKVQWERPTRENWATLKELLKERRKQRKAEAEEAAAKDGKKADAVQGGAGPKDGAKAKDAAAPE